MISVITVCYNSEKTIRKTLESMLLQTYQDYEYIIVDGGSTDGTVAILEEYVSKFEGKMQYKSEADKGIYDAMNKGIQRCHGSLIGIVNSDDWYEIDTLEQVMKAYRGGKYEVVYGMQRTYMDGKECSVLFYHHDFLEKQMIMHPTCLVTKEIYEDMGGYDSEHYKSSADYELILRLFYNGEVEFTPVYRILSNFSMGGISSSSIGVIETVKLKYSMGIISKREYHYTMIKKKVETILKKISKV